MKLLFITDNFPPEVNAPATRTFEHCREWVKKGMDVTVITCAPNFPQGKVYAGYKNKLIQRESIEGIKVIRVWSYITANEGFFKRTFDYFSFAISATLVGLFIKTDKIVATSPQFFAAAAGRWLSFFKRKPWIMEVRDLWPESIKNVVGAFNDSIILKFFEYWEKRLYLKAEKIVVVTDSFKEYIIQKGIAAEKIYVIKNGANAELYTPRQKNTELLNKLNLQNKFVISYIGTHGMAHKLDFILHCASKMNNTVFHFLLIGAGAEKNMLLQLKEELKLINVTMIDPVPKNEVADYLSLSDISLIPLKKAEIFLTVIPSKIFETSAMQIPILLGVEGESKAIIEKYGAGLCFEPENEEDFFQKLNRLYEDKEAYKMHKNGCAELAKAFDRKRLANEMFDILMDAK
ncbi:MAG: glycosyltransferase family 4 protein [Bacteroidota bacterium]